MNQAIITLTLRLILSIFFLSASLATFSSYKFYISDVAKIHTWIFANPTMNIILTLGFFIIAVALIVGIRISKTALTSALLVCINHICLLTNDPIYNTFFHSVPFILMSLGLFYLAENDKFNLDIFLPVEKNPIEIERKKYWIILILRVFIGCLFLFQGLNTIINTGVIEFARKFYAERYQDTFIPQFMLWSMGLLNPLMELVGGLFLIIGFKTKWASYTLCFFLISITFGHMIDDPFETTGDISSYGLNNLFFVLLILYLQEKYNKWSIDNALKKEVK